MIRLLVIAGLVYLGYRKIKSLTGPQRPRNSRAAEPVEDVMVQDAECGTYIPKREAIPLQWGDQELFFCGAQCRDRFIQRKEST